MTTFVIRGVTLTEDGIRKFKEQTTSPTPIDTLVDGFNTALRQGNQHKLSQKEESAFYKWLHDADLFRKI